MSVANLYQNKKLKEKALECISKDLGDVEFSNSLSKNDLVTCLTKMRDDQAKESAIYHAIMSWSKHDENTRKQEFEELLFLVDFTQLSADFIHKMMLIEELVTKHLACLNFVTTKLCLASNKERMKQSGATKVISAGGCETPKKVMEVYSIVDEPAMEYPNVSSSNRINFAEEIASHIYVGTICDFGAKSLWKLDEVDNVVIWKSIQTYEVVHYGSIKMKSFG